MEETLLGIEQTAAIIDLIAQVKCNRMRNFIILFITALFIGGCSDKEIEITTEYIINPGWSKKSEKEGANTIEIKRMKVKRDSVIDPFANLNQAEILNKLEYDSSFFYFANVKIKAQESYQSKKIFFNKENDFYWLKDVYRNIKTKVIGKLEMNNWYKVSKLNYYYFVLYVDSLGKVHRYTINEANY